MFNKARTLSAMLLAGMVFAGMGLAPQRLAAQIAPVPDAAGRKHIYSETSDPKADIDAALAKAKAEHKHVLLDFGGDWCGDCQVLDIYFHREPNADLLSNKFVLVHVFIGHMDKNLDIGAKYGVQIEKGVPALAVLDSRGKVLYAQPVSDFRTMRKMDPSTVNSFLNQWKG